MTGQYFRVRIKRGRALFTALEGMTHHSARRCCRKQCTEEWRDAAYDAIIRRQREEGGLPCFIVDGARVWLDEKVAVEKFSQSETLAADERKKVVVDEVARAVVSKQKAKELAKTRRKHQKQEETKKRTLADDDEASVLDCPLKQAREDKLRAKKEVELPLLVKVVGCTGYEQVPWSENRTASEVVKLMRERSDTEKWSIHMHGKQKHVCCGPTDEHVVSRKGTLREDGVMAGSTVYVRLRFGSGSGAATTPPHHPRDPNPTDPCPSPIPANRISESLPLTVTPATITPWSSTPNYSPVQ